jgi:hypothetical protein
MPRNSPWFSIEFASLEEVRLSKFCITLLNDIINLISVNDKTQKETMTIQF